MFVVRYDSSGDCIGGLSFGAASGSIVLSNESEVIYTAGTFRGTVQVGGTTLIPYYPDSSDSRGDIYLAKHDAITGIIGGERPLHNRLIIYANPTTGKCNITVPDEFLNEKKLALSIYDNTGRIIQQKILEMNEGKIKLNLEEEARGIYNVTLSNGRKSYSGRIVFE